MRNWKLAKDRADATIVFARFMKDPKNAELRQKCCDDPEEAKRQFAIVGEFYLEGEQLSDQLPNEENLTPIPKRVQFKVYDSEDPKRQDLVVLVLPSKSGKDSDQATDIWIAAWEPWTS